MYPSILLKVTGEEAYAHPAGNLAWNITCRIRASLAEGRIQNIVQSWNDVNDVSNG